MAEYALISNGVVVNVIVADASFISTNFPGAVEIDQLTPKPGIGWSYASGSFIAPAAAQPTNSVFTGPGFMDLFTIQELETCFAYQSSVTLTATQKAQLTVFFQYFNSAAAIGIDLTLPQTIQGVQMLESFGLIAAGRSSVILATRQF